jgi:iron complex transport system substrate-binding protein
MPVFRFRSLVAALSLAAVACDRSGSGAAPSSIARDDFGVAVPSGARARRIVSLNPTTTEILFTIGVGSRLVGRTRWDHWPEAARGVPDLGDAIRPNVERVLDARPDLIVLYASADNRSAADRFRASGIPTVGIRVDRIADFRRVTHLLGKLVGDTARANAVVDSVDRTLARVQAATATLPHPRVFLHAWESPLMTIGGGSFLSELVAIAGGRNVFDSLATPSATVTLEDVVRRDPEYVLVGPMSAERLRIQPAWRAVRAVREGRILVYDTTLVSRPSVVMGQAALSLAALLHPSGLHTP